MWQKKKSKIKAVIFDMNGVLALDVELKNKRQGTKSFHKLMAKKLDINIDEWFDAIDTTYADSIEGKISEEKTLSVISKNLKISPKKLEKIMIRTYKKLFKKNIKLYEYAFFLKRRGYKIAILSDQWHFSKKAIMNDKDIKKFNVSIISCDVGMRKPLPKIYKLTLKKIKLKPSEVLFIDNRNWNLKPAEKLGIKTILFRNNKQAIKKIEAFINPPNPNP